MGLLSDNEDFPSQGTRGERITTKLARSFLVNFFKGRVRGDEIGSYALDKNVYEPHLCESGANLDEDYAKLINDDGDELWANKELLEAGKSFAVLHQAQYQAVAKGKESVTAKRLE